jgi:hypothetical protein
MMSGRPGRFPAVIKLTPLPEHPSALVGYCKARQTWAATTTGS